MDSLVTLIVILGGNLKEWGSKLPFYEATLELERYFFVSPFREPGYQQDPTDVRNREFSLPLRGERDFATFLRAGKSQLSKPDWTGAEFDGTRAWLGGIESSLTAVSPAANGIYVDRLFY